MDELISSDTTTILYNYSPGGAIGCTLANKLKPETAVQGYHIQFLAPHDLIQSCNLRHR